MTANRGLFVRNNGTVGTTPVEGRLVLASMVAENSPGVPRQGLLDQKTANLVTGSATDMSYNVGPCSPVLNRATGEGVYMFTLTGTTNVVTDAAPASGSRWDLVYVKQNDPDKGDTGNTAVLGVQKGTAAASPTKPTASLPAGAYVLAEVLVNSGAANAAASGVTITQVWRYTTLRGEPVTVRNQAERDEITPTIGYRVRRLDKTTLSAVGALEAYNGTAWESADSRVVATSATLLGGTLPAGVELITQFGTAVATSDGAGYVRVGYPKAFPNGVVSIIFTDGDGGVAQTNAGWGAGIGFSLGGSAYPSPVSKTDFVYSIWKSSDGSRAINATHRINFVAVGW